MPVITEERVTAACADEPSQQTQIVRHASLASVAVLIGRFTGLAREIVMAHLFGAGFSHDSFLLAFRIANLPRDFFAEGALCSAFVPSFSASLAGQHKAEAAYTANQVTTAILVVVGSLCVLGMLFAPQLVWLLAPGFAGTPGKFELTVELTRAMFPFLLFISLAAQTSGMLNAQGSFGTPAVASIFFNLGSAGCGLLLGFVAGPYLGVEPIHGMAYGVVFGGAMQLLWQRLKLHRLGFYFHFEWDWSHPGFRKVVRLMGPAVIGCGAMQVNTVINSSWASHLTDSTRGHDGPVSWLGFAMRFIQLPLGLFAAAFASAMLPSISRSAAAGNYFEFRKSLSRSLSMIFLVTIPSSLALIVLAKPLIGAVYQSGRFNAYDTEETALALVCYATGLVAYAAARILIPAFYALSDARTPMTISLFSIAANVLFPFVLLNLFHMNFAALALTTASAMTLECLCLGVALHRKLRYFEGHYLLDCFLRIAVAGTAMAMLLMLIHRQFFADAQTPAAYLAELAVSIPAGIALFLFMANLLHVAELSFAKEAFVTAVWRRLPDLRAKIRF